MTPLLTKIWFFYVLSPFSVGAWLEYHEVRYPDVAIRQSLLETGHYKCKSCCLDYNNIFGLYSDHYLRDTIWINSVKRYKDWQDKQMPEICNEEEYYQWLIDYRYACDSVCSYNHAKNYVNTLKQIRLTYNPK